MAIAGIVIAIIGSIAAFIYFHPVFGGKPSVAELEAYGSLPYYKEGKFVNLITTNLMMGFRESFGVALKFLKKDPARQPSQPIPVVKLSSDDLLHNARGEKHTRITWFGHSALLLEIEGKIILLDPMLGPVPAPFPFLGAKRFGKELPITIADLPPIDAVILSHDHYDHLDYGSIKELRSKVQTFYAPLGVGAHLRRWGIAPEKIHELGWGDKTVFDSLDLVCAPARHFSGRSASTRFATLWCSWIIRSGRQNIYFNADSGYGPHFRQIGEEYGPFDIALMECGQYNERWEAIHMLPEQTVQASMDLRAKEVIPIHWGAFRLALHSWTDPIERVTKSAAEHDVPIVTPMIGQTVDLDSPVRPRERWWVV